LQLRVGGQRGRQVRQVQVACVPRQQQRRAAQPQAAHGRRKGDAALRLEWECKATALVPVKAGDLARAAEV